MAEVTYPKEWDKTGEKLYETGVDHGMLYVYDSNLNKYGDGVIWNGLSAVTENPSGGESNAIWADNIKYLDLLSAEEFGATIAAYMYPIEFAECDGSKALATAPGVFMGQQGRKTFGLAYRTKIGSDTDPDKGEKIHLIYGCKASPSERAYNTVNDSPEAINFSWEVSTTPVPIEGHADLKPTSYIVIDSTNVPKEKYEAFKKTLYGDSSTPGKLPTPAEVITAFTEP